ncbi:MAG: LysE family translocator [Oleispira antarctica]|uniref:Putative LysE family protein n=1 Tax=Oleispira antarctica RB-8 TaxID=698738 RepID=R4YR03_OLEAN|nr:LysE family translocator [Oleispira antarctica]MBQ0791336.1 LysE family translocator [Oleispira antarctica]CCK77641.1 Putative LysE family protein [Oleispira antarctica RB-8]
MELTAWISLATLCLLGAMTPGQSFIVILKHSMSGGRFNGFIASMGHGLGVMLYAIATVVGLALIIKQTPWLFDVIKYTGAAFLVWLAYSALTSNSEDSALSAEQVSVTLKQSFYEGLMISFLNPKLAIFFLALFSQFLNDAAGWQHNIIMVATVSGIDTLWYCLVALVLSHSAMLVKLRNNIGIIEKCSGIVLLAVALRVVM